MDLGLTIFGRRFELRTKAIPLKPLSGRGGWWPMAIREPYMGAWQRNDEVSLENVLNYSAVFSCTTLIASDVAKLKLRLVAQDDNGIWNETESPAFSPVIRKPNRYQTIVKFIENYIVSKLVHGNAYVLKQRDNRRIVTALYVLDPTRVTPLVAEDGAVYYELKQDALSNLPENVIVVPASEIIHDTMVTLFHPLMGVSPIFACGLAAMQGLSIQSNSNRVFSNGSLPGGVLTAPGMITDSTAQRVKDYWETNFTGENVGKVAVLGDGLKFERMSYSAVDLQLIDQLKWTGETVCSCYHVPAYMIGIGPPPPYANIEPLLQQYYSQCIQSLLTNFEASLDEGLELPKPYGTEFDIDDLIWMDTATKTKAAGDSIGSGALSPNEARKKYYGLGPVPGGDSCYMQQQNFSLQALAERDRNDPFDKPAPTPQPQAVETAADEEDVLDEAASFFSDLLRKTREGLTDAA